MKTAYYTFLTIVLFLLGFNSVIWAAEKNGFVIEPGLIDGNDIYFGGPPRDGIPSLDEPVFHTADQDRFLQDNDRVLGLVMNKAAKAYPIRILNWHEIVNDRFGTEPVVITYCPLCGTGAAFKAMQDGRRLEFGVSGLLYNSDVLLYDRQTESLWSQIRAQGVTGTYMGISLEQLPLIHTTWQRWKQEHPTSLVLSDQTGFNRDYGRNPYAGYATSKELYFPVEHTSDQTLHPKETVLGVIAGGHVKAYPFSRLKAQGKEQFTDQIGDHKVVISWDERGYSAQAHTSGEIPVSFMQGFWFAWYAFHPQTELFAVR